MSLPTAETLAAAILAIAGTLAIWFGARLLYARWRLPLLNPVFVAITTVIVALRLLGVDYREYDRGGRVISFFLGPAVVALGLPLYLQLEMVRRNALTILAAIGAGSLTGILTGAGVAGLLGAARAVVRSVAPRSVTTPIAMEVAGHLGGIPPLTAAIVIATGMLGAVVGPTLLRRMGVTSPTAIGLAMGAAAHGIGTARAVEEGRTEGAMSGLAMGLNGVVTALLAPLVMAVLGRLLGW